MAFREMMGCNVLSGKSQRAIASEKRHSAGGPVNMLACTQFIERETPAHERLQPTRSYVLPIISSPQFYRPIVPARNHILSISSDITTQHIA